MASIRKTLIGIGLLLFTVPPPHARPASSDEFPWASSSNTGAAEVEPGVRKDAYGALRDTNMLPDTAPPPVTQNPMSTNSLITPAPLFTPGATVPKDGRDQNGATVQAGVIAPGGTVSGSGVAQGNVGATQSGPGAAGLFTPNSPGNAAAYNAQVQGGLTASPIVDGNGANVHVTVPMATPSTVPNYRQYSTGTGSATEANGSSSLVLPGGSTTQTRRDYPGTVKASSIPAYPSRRVSTRRYAARASHLPNFSKQKSSSIGDITGAITYGDGQKVLLGSEGTAVLNSKSRR